MADFRTNGLQTELESINKLAGTTGLTFQEALDQWATNGSGGGGGGGTDDTKVLKAGDTMTGNLVMDGTTGSRLLSLLSSMNGGKGYQTSDSDTTSRIITQSFQTNGPQGGTNSGFFGETIRMDLMNDTAKNMLAWRTLRSSNNTRNSSYWGTTRSVIWAGYHWYAQDQPDINNPTVIHGHYSFAEVPDENDALRTRFAVDVFDPADMKIGVATTNIYTNKSHFSIQAEDGAVLRMFGGMSHERTIEWNILRSPADQTTFRWGLTNDLGDNMKLERRDSASNSKKIVTYANRSNGRFTVGEVANTSGELVAGQVDDAQFTVGSLLGTQNVVILRAGAAMNANGKSFILTKGQNGGDSVIRTTVGAETIQRFVLNASGAMEWGTGAVSRDTSLSRTGAGVLNSPGKITATAGIGVGNSATATSVGTLSRKMEVFDATGASLGFVPIYTTIT